MMSVDKVLLGRAENKCELCQTTDGLNKYLVPPKNEEILENHALLCSTCLAQINGGTDLNPNHFRCLSESMWSEHNAVKVISYRLLKKLEDESWAQDALNMLFLEEDVQEWADNGQQEAIIHKDSNGNVLAAGDTVTLIQDLNVKGAGFTAKRGTAVRRIRLDPDNASHIEGKVDGQHIVILTQYVKKSADKH